MRALVVMALFGLMGCQGQAGTKESPESKKEAAAPQAEKAAEAKLYTVSAVPEALDSASENTILVQFKPVAGYHWNLEYPTSFKVESKVGVKTDKAAYSVAEGSITASETGADLPMKVQVQKGYEGLKLVGNFSLCQADSCKLFRNEAVEVPLTLK